MTTAFGGIWKAPMDEDLAAMGANLTASFAATPALPEEQDLARIDEIEMSASSLTAGSCFSLTAQLV